MCVSVWSNFLFLEPADQIPADEVNAMITDIKQNCKLVVELTGELEQDMIILSM